MERTKIYAVSLYHGEKLIDVSIFDSIEAALANVQYHKDYYKHVRIAHPVIADIERLENYSTDGRFRVASTYDRVRIK